MVGHKDRGSRLGVASLQTRMQTHGRDRGSITEEEKGQEGQGDLLPDGSALITAFCARRSGRRRASRKKTQVVAALEVTR